MIREEHADVLLSYDPQGGYSHPDHVKVHQVGALAAQMTGTRAAAHCAETKNGKGRAAGLYRAMVALPAPALGLFFGHEWFAEPGAARAIVFCRMRLRSISVHEQLGAAAGVSTMWESPRWATPRQARGLRASRLPA
jgi:LmbE family N-acetylglucosaminyl deacetylase